MAVKHLGYAFIGTLLAGCGGLPDGARDAIFHSPNFVGPISIDAGDGDGQAQADLAYSRRIDRGILPTIWTTTYRNSDKRFLTFLVSNGFARVECIVIRNRMETVDTCFVIHSDKIASLKKAAHRELVSIEYVNKYNASPMGFPITFHAVTFKYRIVSELPGVPRIGMHFDGQARSFRDLDTGRWVVDQLRLSDNGDASLRELITASHEPFNPATMAFRRAITEQDEEGPMPGANVSLIGLSVELSNAIRDDHLTGAQRYQAVRALLARGADVAGSGIEDVPAPATASVERGDPQLLQMLLSNGLTFTKDSIRKQCLLHVAARRMSTVRGREVFKLLVANGAISEPACIKGWGETVAASITFGIGMADYDVAGAVEGLRVLKAAGVNVHERGPDSKTLLDKLSSFDADTRARAQPMIECLRATK